MFKKTWYFLPEKDRERLNRTELRAARWLVTVMYICFELREELAERLKCIPNGQARFNMMLGHVQAIANDVIGTVPKSQKDQIQHTIDDMDIRLVPKFAPKGNRVVLDLYQLHYIVSHAQKDEALCQTCVRTDDECRKCEFYKILSAIAPLTDWGSGTMCPYSGDWLGK